MKKLQIPQKLVYEKFYVHEQILRTRNGCRKCIKNLLPEKRKEKPRFKSRLNNLFRYGSSFFVSQNICPHDPDIFIKI